MAAHDVIATMAAHIVEPRVDNNELTLIARYSPTRPYAVMLDFVDGDSNPVTWVTDRAMLLGGLDHHSGIGDIQIAPSDDADGQTRITLSGDCAPGLQCHMTVGVASAMLRAFLDATFVQVPLGAESEHCDWDTALTRLTTATP